MTRQYIKYFLILLVVAITAIAIFQGHESYVRSVELNFYRQHIGSSTLDLGDNTSSRQCRLPIYDPFDPTIIPYLKKWPKISCGRPQLPLTFLDEDGILHLNSSAIKEAGFVSRNIQCAYHEIKRKEKDDFHIELGPPQFILNPEKMDAEFSVVRCFEGKGLHKVYETGHAQVRSLDSDLAARSHEAFTTGAVNVFILVLDSMSRLNFIRQLPKTYDILTKVFKSTVLEGLTKVGDNTYPNMVVMLAGLASSRRTLDKSLGPFFGNINASRGNFDHLPAVWKNFSARGYVTMYAEDLPEYATFNYLAKGFYDPPTHFYMRPFWLAMEQQKKLKSKDNRCYGHIPKHQFLFNYSEQFLYSMSKGENAYFALSFLTSLSHDSINSVKVIDGELASFFARLYKKRALENTMLVVMGDHGNRFDPIRKTVIGRVEERMPFFALSLPSKLSHFRGNLKANKNVLTSWHDVYETLMDVAMDNLAPVSKQVRFGHRGLSLFHKIPSNRTCSIVGVPREYCVCWVEKELGPSDATAMAAGHVVVDHVNRMLAHSHAQLCVPLQLEQVLSAQLLLPSEPVATPSGLHVLLRVTVRALPSGALLEATMERKAWSKEDRILGDVNRINQYGNESICIEDKLLRLYCYCK